MTKIHHNFIERDKIDQWKEYTCGVCSLAAPDNNCDVELSDFDYAVIEYWWTNNNGDELDTRTYISLPDRKNNTIGWIRLGSDEEYLTWGGDGSSEFPEESPNNAAYDGFEAILCDFNLIKTDFNNSEIKVSLNAFWYSESGDHKFTVAVKTYKNGSMVKNGLSWDNVDGQLVQQFNFQSMADDNGGAGDIDGFVVGEIVYTRATNSFILKKDCLNDDDISGPPITECNAKPLSMSFPNYILVPEGGSVVMAVNSNIGGQTGSEVYSLNPELYRTTEEGQAVNLLNFIEDVLYSYYINDGSYLHFNTNTYGESVDMDLCDVGYREFYIRPEPDTRYSNSESRLILVVDGVQYNLPIQTVDKTYDPTEANITDLLTSACQAIVDLGIPATLENYEVFGVQKLHIKIGPALNSIYGYAEFGSGWDWESTGHRIINCVENVNSNYLNEPAEITIEPVLPGEDEEQGPGVAPDYASISFSPVAIKSPADIDVFDLITFSNAEKECVSCNSKLSE